MPIHAAVTGWGSSLPRKIVTNQDLERFVDTNDEWIRSRTGISQRRVASEGETSLTMGLAAAREALARAQLSPRDIDLVIFASTTPDYLIPSTACLIQQHLGASHAGAFDLNAACTSFIYGLSVGSQFIKTGAYRRVLIVSAECLSRYVNWNDRSTCVLFGDGAGAVVLEAASQPGGVLSFVLGSRGDVEKMLVVEAGGAALPASAQTIADGSHLLKMRGNEVFKVAVRNMAQAAREALDKAGLTLDDIKAVIPHQANLRIISATQDLLGIPPEKLFVNVDRFGNTGAASIPIAIAEYLGDREAEEGDNFLFVAFGGGLTWAAAAVRWVDIPAVRRSRLSGPHLKAGYVPSPVSTP